MLDLPIFFINLDRHPERRRFMETQFAELGVDAERFAGVDGAAVPPHLASYIPSESPLSAAQIGCSASHLQVMLTIVERGYPAALVLEDDAILPTGLSGLLDDVLHALPAHWDIVRLCRRPKRAFRPLRDLRAQHRLVRYSRIPLGRAGYLASASGARKLLGKRQFRRPGDVEIAHPWLLDLDVYGVVPPPITQERKALLSTISAAGRRGDIGRLKRAMPDGRAFFNMRKLGLAWWLRCSAANALRRIIPIAAPQAPSHSVGQT